MKIRLLRVNVIYADRRSIYSRLSQLFAKAPKNGLVTSILPYCLKYRYFSLSRVGFIRKLK